MDLGGRRQAGSPWCRPNRPGVSRRMRRSPVGQGWKAGEGHGRPGVPLEPGAPLPQMPGAPVPFDAIASVIPILFNPFDTHNRSDQARDFRAEKKIEARTFF